MEIVYGIMWFAVAFLLIFKFSKENKIFYFLGSFFLIMGAWFIANPLLADVELFEGIYVNILRGIAGFVLVVTGIYYYKNIYNGGKNKGGKK